MMTPLACSMTARLAIACSSWPARRLHPVERGDRDDGVGAAARRHPDDSGVEEVERVRGPRVEVDRADALTTADERHGVAGCASRPGASPPRTRASGRRAGRRRRRAAPRGCGRRRGTAPHRARTGRRRSRGSARSCTPRCAGGRRRRSVMPTSSHPSTWPRTAWTHAFEVVGELLHRLQDPAEVSGQALEDAGRVGVGVLGGRGASGCSSWSVLRGHTGLRPRL